MPQNKKEKFFWALFASNAFEFDPNLRLFSFSFSSLLCCLAQLGVQLRFAMVKKRLDIERPSVTGGFGFFSAR